MSAVPAGYKQTEVGLIPEDWEVKPFTQVTDLITCGIAATPQYVHESRGFPFLSSTNVKEGRILWSGYKHICADLHRQLYRNNPPKNGDILYSRVGTFGEAAVVDVDFEFSVYVSLTLIKPGKPLDSLFLMQLLNSEAYKRRAKDQIYLGGGVGNLNVDVVRRYPIVIPPLPEQRAIAAALSDVDALLTKLDQFIAKKRDLKQAAMQQLLTGQTRLPGFGGEWEVKRLGEVAQIVMGQSPSSANYNTKGLGLPLTQGNADIANRKTIRRIFTTEITKLGKCGDILMSVRAPVGEISRAVFDVCLGRGVCAIRYPNDFLYHYLISQEPSWAKLSKGSTFDSVNSADVKKLEVHLPRDVAEQTAIATVLSDMDAELAALEARRDKTRALKQGMMQELLTGRIRLVGPDAYNRTDSQNLAAIAAT